MTSAGYYTAAGIATAASATGTAIQTNDVLQWISLAITIIGAIISFIVLPVIDWYKQHKDEEKTIDDYKELLDNIKEGVDNVKDVLEESKDKEVDKNATGTTNGAGDDSSEVK